MTDLLTPEQIDGYRNTQHWTHGEAENAVEALICDREAIAEMLEEIRYSLLSAKHDSRSPEEFSRCVDGSTEMICALVTAIRGNQGDSK